MTVKINVGPPVLTINKSNTFMVTDYLGEIEPTLAQGVFADDTRFVSTYRLWVSGKKWLRLSSAAVSYHSAHFYLVNPEVDYPIGPSAVSGSRLGTAKIPFGSVGLKLVRSIDEGVLDIFEVTNYGADEISIVLALELESDFADIFEVKGGESRLRQNLVTQWDIRRVELRTTYEDRDFRRGFIYKVVDAEQLPSYAGGRLRFPIQLGSHASWRSCSHMLIEHGGVIRRPGRKHSPTEANVDRAARLHRQWLESCTTMDSPCQDLVLSYRQSVEDMGALRLLERDVGPETWVPAAGVPWFVTLFGRDTLVASTQNMAVHAPFAEGALRILAQYQARERDDWRDAQPGKIMHEVRYGELAHFHLVPQTPYYGTWDATPLYLMVLYQAWRWLGDRKLIEDLRSVAEGCLQWIDEYGDLGGGQRVPFRASPTGAGRRRAQWTAVGESYAAGLAAIFGATRDESRQDPCGSALLARRDRVAVRRRVSARRAPRRATRKGSRGPHWEDVSARRSRGRGESGTCGPGQSSVPQRRLVCSLFRSSGSGRSRRRQTCGMGRLETGLSRQDRQLSR